MLSASQRSHEQWLAGSLCSYVASRCRACIPTFSHTAFAFVALSTLRQRLSCCGCLPSSRKHLNSRWAWNCVLQLNPLRPEALSAVRSRILNSIYLRMQSDLAGARAIGQSGLRQLPIAPKPCQQQDATGFSFPSDDESYTTNKFRGSSRHRMRNVKFPKQRRALGPLPIDLEGLHLILFLCSNLGLGVSDFGLG